MGCHGLAAGIVVLFGQTNQVPMHRMMLVRNQLNAKGYLNETKRRL